MNLNQLIPMLMSPDNNVRGQAESAYEQLKATSPADVVMHMTSTVRYSTDASTKAFSAVLLRRLFQSKSGVWAKLSSDLQTGVKQELLAAMEAEDIRNMQQKLSHAIAELAKCCTSSGSWPELLPTVLAWAKQSSLRHQMISLELLARISEYKGQLLHPFQPQMLELVTGFLNSSDLQIQLAALHVTVEFLASLTNSEEMEPFKPCIDMIFKVIERYLSSGNDMEVRDALSALVKLADTNPKFFRNHLENCGVAMSFITLSKNLEASTREMALEFLVTLCENAGGMIRKNSTIISKIVPIAMALLCEAEDDEDWKNRFSPATAYVEFDGDSDEDSLAEAGAGALERSSRSLGGNSILPIVFPIIQTYLTDAENWRRRRAALIAFCLLGEGCKQGMQQDLKSIVTSIAPFCKDSHERVRFAAIHALAQLCDDFGGIEMNQNFQADFHSFILPEFIDGIKLHQEVPRTQVMACSGLIHFCTPHKCKASHLIPYLEPVLSTLFEILRTGKREVQEEAVTAVATIARCAEQHFDKYYDVFIQLAKSILVQAVGKDFSLLRGKAMESIALIGKAVGKDRFSKDAHEVMSSLLQLQNNNSLEGPEVKYIAQSCARIGNVLQDDFLQYMPLVIPPLLEQAKTEADVSIVDEFEEDEDEDDDGLERVLVDVEGEGQKCLVINTHALEEKNVACNMIYQYALDLEGSFCPYIEQVANVMLPLLKYEYSPNIRIVSALLIPKLVHSAVEGSFENLQLRGFPQQVFSELFGALMNAIKEEDDLEVLGAMAEAVSATLQTCKDAITEKNMAVGVEIQDCATVVDMLQLIAQASADRRMRQELENLADEDYDEEAAMQQEESEELEDGIFISMIDSIGWIIKTTKEAFLPIFKAKLQPLLHSLLSGKDILPLLRAQSICMLDDIIEHCGSQAHELLPFCLPPILDGLLDPYPNVRQAASYGIGVCAEFAGQGFDSFVKTALDRLVQAITAEESRANFENEAATDNAISAVSKLYLHRTSQINATEIFPLWLSWLPIKGDVEEAREVHARLVTMVESGGSNVLGQNFSNLATILAVFANILILQSHQENGYDEEDDEDNSIIDTETKMRLLAILQKLQLPADVIQTAWANLSPEQQHAFSMQ